MPPNSNNNNNSLLPLVVSISSDDSENNNDFYNDYSVSSISSNNSLNYYHNKQRTVRKSSKLRNKKRRRRIWIITILWMIVVGLAFIYIGNLVLLTNNNNESSTSVVNNNNNNEKWILYRSIQQHVTLHSSESDICHKNTIFEKEENKKMMCSVHYSHHRPNNTNTNNNINEYYPLHCVSSTKNTTPELLDSIDQSYNTSAWNILLQRVDWPWAMMLVLLLGIFYGINYGGEQQSIFKRITIIALYLFTVVLYKKFQPNNNGWISSESLSDTIPFASTIYSSYYAFVIVHPLDGSILLLCSHMGTYWFQVAAWFYAKTIRQILIWYILYEVVTSFCNEYLHNNSHHDHDHEIMTRCTRVSYVHDMKQYAVDDMIRAYLLPPFFVYLYLMPKFIYQNIYSILAHFMSMK